MAPPFVDCYQQAELSSLPWLFRFIFPFRIECKKITNQSDSPERSIPTGSASKRADVWQRYTALRRMITDRSDLDLWPCIGALPSCTTSSGPIEKVVHRFSGRDRLLEFHSVHSTNGNIRNMGKPFRGHVRGSYLIQNRKIHISIRRSLIIS